MLLSELRAGGMTILFVTHEADIAAFAARSIVMKDGAVQRDERQVSSSTGVHA
jgi:putative ABC transport system ATP-binding protein